MRFLSSRIRLWTPLDWSIGLYAVYVAILIVACFGSIPKAWLLLALHAALFALLLSLPPRGADWERRRREPSPRVAMRRLGVLLRYMYPLPLVLGFFEEGRFIVNGLFPAAPYWFEPYLYAADRWLFGDLPSVVLVPWISPLLTELMHAFYSSYFVILVFGPILARGGRRIGEPSAQGFAAPAFEAAMSGMILGFLCAFVWYPWLPARGPFENTELMAALPPFDGGPLTVLARGITDGAAVSGNCFPSGHVAGTWGLVFGTAAHRPKPAVLLGALAVGISLSCVYTRYHHGVDVPAGFLMGLLGAAIARATRRRDRQTRLRHTRRREPIPW